MNAETPDAKRWQRIKAIFERVMVVGDDLYFDSSATYQVVRHGDGPERMAVSEQTLRHRLHTHGLLVSIDTARQTLLVRRTLGGCPRHVLHLKASDLVGSIMQSREVKLACCPAPNVGSSGNLMGGA